MNRRLLCGRISRTGSLSRSLSQASSNSLSRVCKMSCACSHARSQVSSRSQLRYATVLRGRSLELAPSRAIHRDRFSRFAEVIAVAFSAISRKAGAVALATRASCGSLRLRWQVAALSRDRSWRIAGFFVVIFREPASLSRSPLRVCELHRSRFREFVKCITLAFEQVCDLHAVASANHAVLSRSFLRETIAIAFAIHSWLIVFALSSTRHRHGCDCESVEGIAIAQAIRRSHRGRLSRSRGILAIAFAIRSSFIVAAFASTQHHRNRVCDLRNHLRSLLATRGIHRDRFSARSRTHCDHSCEVAGKRRAWLSSVLVAEADGAKS